MDKVHVLTPFIISWLISYVVHSTILLGLASVAHYLGIPQQRRLAELVWRLALFGGIVTASLQVGIQLRSHTEVNHGMPNVSQQANATPRTSISVDSDKSTPTAERTNPAPIQDSAPIEVSLLQASKATLDAPQNDATLLLPSSLQGLMSAVILTWLIYSLFVLTKIVLGVSHLNRLANAMPMVNQSDINELLAKHFPNSNKLVRLRVSDAFNSPFVCPNGTICLPAWVLEQSNQSLCHAMLDHEIRHIIRRDGAWRIAYEMMKGIFFFQILNRAAERQLTLLAEIDCDHIAVKANGVDTFAQALVRCAEMAVASKHPAFAIPMANSPSLLQRIDFILNEDIMKKQTAEKRNQKISISALSLGLIAIGGLSGFCYAMPAIGFAEETKHNLGTGFPIAIKQATISASEAPSPAPIVQDVTTDHFSSKESSTNGSNTEQQAMQSAVSESSSHSVANHLQQADKLEQAQAAYTSKNFVEALQLFLELAKLGHVKAQYAAGDMLWRGEGSAVNVEAATTLLTQAANHGHPEAQQYAALFTQRAQRQSEINFYTQQFDGGKLKWTEQVCERPLLSSTLPSAKDYREIVNKLNANLNCYNNYVASLKQSLANEEYLHADLRRLMRPDEIEQSKQLVRNVYFDMGVQAMQHTQQLLTEFDKKNEIWLNEAKAQSGRHVALNDEMVRSHFTRMERRQVEVETGTRSVTTTTNPTVAPTTK